MRRILAILVSISLFTTPLSAQVEDPVATDIAVPLSPDLTVGMTEGDDPAGIDNANPGDVPVDGGLSLLLAAAAAYGSRRLWHKDDGKSG